MTPLGASVYSMLWTHSLEDAIGLLAAEGFTNLEIVASAPHAAPRELSAEDRGRIRNACRREGVSLTSVNAPTIDLNLAALDPLARQTSLDTYLDITRLAADVEAPRVVVSPGRVHPLLPPPLEMARKWSKDSLSVLMAEGERLGTTVAIENLPYGLYEVIDDILILLAEMNSPAGGMVFDIANAFGHEDPSDGLRRAWDQISLIHLSDTTLEQWLHAEIGTGQVDFQEIALSVRDLDLPQTILELTVVDPIPSHIRSRKRLAAMGWPSVSEEVGG